MYNKLSIGFDCLGQQHLKNVANPVTGYRVLQVGAGTPPRASELADLIARLTRLKDMATLIEGKPRSLLGDKHRAFLDIPFEEGVIRGYFSTPFDSGKT